MSRDFSSGNRLNVGNPAATNIPGTALTLSTWFRQDAAGSGTLIGKYQAGTERQYLLYVTGGSQLSMLVGDGGPTNFDEAIGNTLPNQQWIHGAGVKNGTGSNALKVYVGGKEQNSVTSNLVMTTTSRALLFGELSSLNLPLNGQMAHTAIWDVPLTPQEIHLLSLGISPLFIRPNSLKGYWPLDDYGASGIARDHSLHNNTATMTGTVGLTPQPLRRPISEYTLLVGIPGTPGVNYNDSATVYVKITPSGFEFFDEEEACFVGEGEAMLRWEIAGVENRWQVFQEMEPRFRAEFGLGARTC